jgi:hypothetical protein
LFRFRKGVTFFQVFKRAAADIFNHDLTKEWTRYEFGLGQGILGMESGK